LSRSSVENRLPKLTRGLSVYQDVLLAGHAYRRGARDCEGRWRAIEPHLPARGTILDVGSNFGWFGLQIAQSRPETVVVSCEADLRSASVQQTVLRSHAATRVLLLTQRAGADLAARLAAAGQRLDAVLCLSVLHWIADHRRFLTGIGAISGRLLIEHPDHRERGAGVERIRQAIGPIGPYLQSLFPDREVRCVAQWPGHRDPALPRQLWLVEEPAGWTPPARPQFDAATALAAWPAWPPRSWWKAGLDDLVRQRPAKPSPAATRVVVAPTGLAEAQASPSAGVAPGQLRRRLWRIPEYRVTPWWRGVYLTLRRTAGATLRALRLRKP